jgi:aminopeptidase N
MLRQMRTWALEHSDQGPVYLGYRLGHTKGDSRIFRALVYNKGAVVLHMLRRLLGDEVFFRGIRRFYASARYRKVGTESLRQAMEEEAGYSLERFFERWIYGSSLPDLSFGYHVENTPNGQEAILRVTQTGNLFDVPVTVKLTYLDGRTADILLRVTDRSTDQRVALDGRLRSAVVTYDDGTLAEVRRASP